MAINDDLNNVLNNLFGRVQEGNFEKPEPSDAITAVNSETLHGLTKNKDDFFQSLRNQQQQPQQQSPNALEMQAKRGLLGAKNLYMAAPEGATGDPQRQQASQWADLIRTAANSSGINLSGYGADNSLEDAAKNFESQRARDIMRTINGEYSRSSDRYYEDTYEEAIRRGLSDRRAKRLAGNMAREYQANRVAYLNNVYNSYGRDGNVTNEFGNQFIAALATENPMLANYYAQIYPNAKDAYKRENQLEDKAIDQTNAFAKMVEAFNLNEAAADNAFARNERAKDNDLPRRLKEYTEKGKIDLKNWQEQQAILEKYKKEQPDKVDEYMKQFWKIAKALGFSDEEAYAYAVNNTADKLLSKRGSEEKLSDKEKAKYNQLNNLMTSALEEPTDANITALEVWLQGDDITEGNAVSLDPYVYNEAKHFPNLIKGLQAKLRADDNTAHSYWKNIPKAVLKKYLPNENFPDEAYEK